MNQDDHNNSSDDAEIKRYYADMIKNEEREPDFRVIVVILAALLGMLWFFLSGQ